MVYCQNCGTEVPEGMKFCSNCGTKVAEENKVQNEIVQRNAESGSYMPADNSYYVKPDKNRQLAKVQRLKNEKSAKAAGYWTPGILLGIVSIVIAIFGICYHKTWPSTFMSVFALILGIVCLVKKSKLPGLAIAGIVIAVMNFMSYSWGYDHTEKERAQLERQVEYLEDDLAKAEQASATKPLGSDYKVVEKEQASEPADVTKVESDEDEKESAAEKPAEEETQADTGIVDPDLKAFLDSYEKFMDEYVEFMQKYSANPTDLTLLTEYADMMEKYSDFAEKIDKYDSDEMSAADAAYYLEVTTRVSQKLLKAYSD